MYAVLVVDDSSAHRRLTRVWLDAAGAFTVTESASAADGLARIAADRPDCVVLDHVLPPADGLQVLAALRGYPTPPPVVLFTCGLTDELRRNALALGAVACLDKSKTAGPDLAHAVLTAVLARARGTA